MSVEEIETEPDVTEGWALQYVIVGVCVVILLSAFVVWIFLSGNLVGGGRSNPYYSDTIPPQASFDSEMPLEVARHAERLQLEEWSWADRAHTLVREPIDVAIDQYLQRGGAPPRPQPSPQPPPQEHP